MRAFLRGLLASARLQMTDAALCKAQLCLHAPARRNRVTGLASVVQDTSKHRAESRAALYDLLEIILWDTTPAYSSFLNEDSLKTLQKA